jgi:hypothetical protein
MNESSNIHQVSYIISIRSENPPLGSPIFCGTLEIVSGQKFEFGTIAELNSLLCEIGGWIDTPPLCAPAAAPEVMSTEVNEGRIQSS